MSSTDLVIAFDVIDRVISGVFLVKSLKARNGGN